MSFWGNNVFIRHAEILRFLVSGGIAFLVSIGVLYLLTEVFDIWYLISSILSFLVTFIVSFVIQKNWTFKNRGLEGISSQIGMSLVMAIINLGLNTSMMYVFVEYIHLHYLSAQILATGLIAIETYFIYKYIIFTQKENKKYS